MRQTAPFSKGIPAEETACRSRSNVHALMTGDPADENVRA
jgi:hypothetical protein